MAEETKARKPAKTQVKRTPARTRSGGAATAKATPARKAPARTAGAPVKPGAAKPRATGATRAAAATTPARRAANGAVREAKAPGRPVRRIQPPAVPPAPQAAAKPVRPAPAYAHRAYPADVALKKRSFLDRVAPKVAVVFGGLGLLALLAYIVMSPASGS